MVKLPDFTSLEERDPSAAGIMPSFESKFWQQRADWPRDHAGNVFLARAVDKIGRAMYPESWTCQEAALPEPYGLWRDGSIGQPAGPIPQAKAPSLGRAIALLEKYRPDMNARLIYDSNPWRLKYGQPENRLSDEHWIAACEIARDLDEALAPDRDRLASVKREIRDGLADGRLISVLRHPSGGSFSEPVAADWWNIEDKQLDRRFAACQMNPRRPFGENLAGPDCMLIFVTSKSLKSFADSVTASQAAGAPHSLGHGRFRKMVYRSDPELS